MVTRLSQGRSLIAAAVYLVLGAVGISFAIAPSYASPIFPAAGFAVAYLLWAGSSSCGVR